MAIQNNSTGGYDMTVTDVQPIKKGEHKGDVIVAMRVSHGELARNIAFQVNYYKVPKMSLEMLKERAREEFEKRQREDTIHADAIARMQKLIGNNYKI